MEKSTSTMKNSITMNKSRNRERKTDRNRKICRDSEREENMKKMSIWLNRFHGKLDEKAVGKMVNKLDLHPLDLLAIANKIVQSRKSTVSCVPRKKQRDTHIDVEDDEDQERLSASIEKRKRPMNRNSEILEMESSVSTLVSCIPINTHKQQMESVSVSTKDENLKREEGFKKSIQCSVPMTWSVPSKNAQKSKREVSQQMESASLSPKDENLKREEGFKKSVQCSVPMTWSVPSKKARKSKKEVIN